MKRSFALCGATAVVLALSACAVPSGSAQPETTATDELPLVIGSSAEVVVVAASADVSALTYDSDPKYQMQALSGGELSVVGDHCLGVVSGGEELHVIWPFGTTFASDGMSIEPPGAGVIELGDSVVLGGGHIAGPAATGGSSTRCSSGDRFASHVVERG